MRSLSVTYCQSLSVTYGQSHQTSQCGLSTLLPLAFCLLPFAFFFKQRIKLA
ncbi:MAG: hypothetical protein F6K56_24780 [Moorea sp. SIO3G5]|nr:hypothetical protein [Moorena sp. SIO3G5]